MKYPALKNKPQQGIKTDATKDFNTGINDDKGDCAGEGNILKDVKNMQFSGGSFCTRSGFCANTSAVIAPEAIQDITYFPFTLTDTVCHYNAKAYNLAYVCFGTMDAANMRFYLVDFAGNILPAGGIDFTRVDSQHFFVPTNIMFMVAQPVTGSGVFAIIKKNSNGEIITEFLEASSDFGSWTTVKGNYYIPTVRINGRGERYEQASEYSNLKLSAPERPEELNMLTGKHKSYYTSDGFSSIFRLPYGNLSQTATFKCRVYTSPESYTEWSISSGANNASATFNGGTVHVHINRTLGVMRFLKNGADYAVPFMEDCKINNIEIIAVTDDIGGEEDIASCKGAVALDGRLYLYGGKQNKNCVYCVRQSNPLYFPQSNKIFLGDGGTGVTAIKVQNGKLIAFKPGETYRIITYFDKESLEKEAVLPERTTYVKSDTLGMQTIDNGVGCAAPGTIRLCGNRLVWLGEDNCVYALATTTYGNTTNIYKVSQPLGDRLASVSTSAGTPFAVTEGGQYMLFLGAKIFVMNFRVRGFGYSKTYYAGDDEIKSPAWYIWEPPAGVEFKNGTVAGGKAVFTCAKSGGGFFYTAIIGGETDKSLDIVSGAVSTVTSSINSGFKTKIFDFGDSSRYKRLDSIFISGGCQAPVIITVTEKDNSYSLALRLGNEQYIRISGDMPAVREIALAFSANRPFYIKDLGFKYKMLGNRG